MKLNEYNGVYINDSMSGGPAHWSYSIKFYPNHGSRDRQVLCALCQPFDGIVSFVIYVDPSGYIYDTETGARIPGATVWLQWFNNATFAWENVPVGNTTANMLPDVNPQTTDSAGGYAWDTLPGTFRVHVEANGYISKASVAVTVPPPEFNLQCRPD